VVKVQHRGLQRMATTDMRVVQALLEAVKVLRPEFGSFDWLVEEVRKKDIYNLY
jgi:predicted unusual protein kinase regulating ubiquinone biosynthesis (AarF/ABC1/UbiB family)